MSRMNESPRETHDRGARGRASEGKLMEQRELGPVELFPSPIPSRSVAGDENGECAPIT